MSPALQAVDATLKILDEATPEFSRLNIIVTPEARSVLIEALKQYRKTLVAK
jgi:hypothetical protein